MLELAIACAAYVAGFYTLRTYGLIRGVYLKWKHGICFQYKATGVREWREGTLSDFCQRCGQPYGYHR